MNFQKTSLATKALSLMSVSAAILIGLPVSAQMGNSGGSTMQNGSGAPTMPNGSGDGGAVAPDGAVGDQKGTAGQDGRPGMGMPDASPNSPSAPRGSRGTMGCEGSTGTSSNPAPAGLPSGAMGNPSGAADPSVSANSGVNTSPTSREACGTMGGNRSSEGPGEGVKKGPSAVGEGFPGPSESPSGSPSVRGTSVYGNPSYESQPRRN